MKFITITLIVHAPDATGTQKSTRERFQEVIENALLAEELGFDGFGVGERQKESVDLPARYGDPLFSANVTNPIDPYAELIDYYRERWVHYGHPQQVIEKVYRYHKRLSHQVIHLHADAGGLTDAQHRESHELFQAEIAPVLRKELPDPPMGWDSGPVVSDAVAAGTPATNAAAPITVTG